MVHVTNDDIRANSKMTQFTFFLDDVTKLEVMKKLKSIGLDTQKGAISATIRVLLREFVTTQQDPLMKDKIEKEYVFTTKKNKRSSL